MGGCPAAMSALNRLRSVLWSARLRWHVACVVAVVLGIFTGTQLLSGAWGDYRAAEARVMEQRAAFVEKQRRAENPEAWKQQVAELQQMLQIVVGRLPSVFDENEIQRALEARATLNGVRLDVVRRLGAESKEFYAELAFDVVLHGRAASVAAFLDDTAADARMQTMRSLAMTLPPGADAADLRTEITLVYYRYIEEP
jgi:type IV pilus assembly protein PilO